MRRGGVRRCWGKCEVVRGGVRRSEEVKGGAWRLCEEEVQGGGGTKGGGGVRRWWEKGGRRHEEEVLGSVRRRWDRASTESGVFLQLSPQSRGLQSLAELNRDWLLPALLLLLLLLLLFLLLCNSLISCARLTQRKKPRG